MKMYDERLNFTSASLSIDSRTERSELADRNGFFFPRGQGDSGRKACICLGGWWNGHGGLFSGLHNWGQYEDNHGVRIDK